MKVSVFFLAILLLSNCSLTKEKNKFSGNWYSCANDGLYIELLIKDNTFRYSTGNGLVTKWYDYKINGDTLKYSDPHLYKDSTINKKALIINVNKDVLIMDFITSKERWTFYKISENITDIDNDDKLIKSTKQRAHLYSCPDKRSTEEKTKDSAMKFIYFQF
jgi:hypothetical protein